MTCEIKLRTLAAADVTLQSYFGTPSFRWFNLQLEPNYIQQGPCAVMTRVSTVRQYTMDGLNQLSQPRMQIDVFDYDSIRCAAAANAIIAFMGTIDLASDNVFASPPTSPTQSPVFLLNQRSLVDPRTNPKVYREMLEYRIFNLED